MCTLSLVYFVLTFDDLVQIQKAPLKGIRLAYCVDVFRMAVETVRPTLGNILRICSWLILLLTVLFAVNTRLHASSSPARGYANSINGFWMGSSIYIGTFLLDTNDNYRLTFLLFTIPQLVYWIRQKDVQLARRSTLALVSIMISLSIQFFARFPDQTRIAQLIFLVDELANWLTFGFLLQLWIYSLPAWILDIRNSAKPEARGAIAG